VYEDWKKLLGEGVADTLEFQASKGWFDSFKSRACIHNIKLASADKEAVQGFVKPLSEITEEGGYSACQIFNVKETVLFWKKMPAPTYLAKERVAAGHKAASEPGSSVSIVSGYRLDNREIKVRSLAEAKGFFLWLLCPDQLWVPPSLLYNEYWGSFARG
jgi:hypothetical protein